LPCVKVDIYSCVKSVQTVFTVDNQGFWKLMVYVLKKRYLLPGQGWFMGIACSLFLTSWLGYSSPTLAIPFAHPARYLGVAIGRQLSIRADWAPALGFADLSEVESH